MLTGQIVDRRGARQHSRGSDRRSDARGASETSDPLILHRNLLDVGSLNDSVAARFLCDLLSRIVDCRFGMESGFVVSGSGNGTDEFGDQNKQKTFVC